MEAIATAAAIGPSAISWWLIFIIGYFLPFSLIAAELGSTYPEQGGLFAWVKRAFGGKWAARTTWYYWISLPIWIPAIYIAFAEILGRLFFPGLTLWHQVLIGLAMIWITVIVNIWSLESSKWVTNLGSISKVIIALGMFAAAGVFFLRHGRLANDLSLARVLPNLNAAAVFIPIIVYNLLGCELISSAAGEMKDPRRDVPRAVIYSALAIAALYLTATLLIWVVVPASEISVSSGIIQMFAIAFDVPVLGGLVTAAVGLFVLGALFSGVVAWTLGENRAMAEAARSGAMPGIFGLMNKNNAPVGASVLSGLISTLIIVAYWFIADNAAEMFWQVTAFCLVVDLLSYLILFPAYIVLRKRDRNIDRPYRVPGPDWLAYALAIVAGSFILVTVVILCLQPGRDFAWSALPVIVGTIISVAVGEILIRSPGVF